MGRSITQSLITQRNHSVSPLLYKNTIKGYLSSCTDYQKRRFFYLSFETAALDDIRKFTEFYHFSTSASALELLCNTQVLYSFICLQNMCKICNQGLQSKSYWRIWCLSQCTVSSEMEICLLQSLDAVFGSPTC